MSDIAIRVENLGGPKMTEGTGGAPPGEEDAAVISEVLRRIVQIAQPERIILFGSAARGEMGPNSDLDFLVVAHPGTHRRRLAQTIYEAMLGVERPVDIVVVTQDDIDRYGQSVGLVLASALREGRVVYERPGAA